MVSFTNNPFLGQVETIEGAKHRIDRLIFAQLNQLRHVTDVGFVQRRLTTTGVNTVGSHDQLLVYWKAQVKKQMQATHGTEAVSAAPPPVVHKKKKVLQRLGKVVGFATPMLL